MSFSSHLLYNVVKYDRKDNRFIESLGITSTMEEARGIIIKNSKPDCRPFIPTMTQYEDEEFMYRVEEFYTYW